MAAGSVVERFPESGDYLTFLEEFLLRNQPCVFSETHTRGWKARQRWQTAGKPELKTLYRDFGDVSVPVADCCREEFRSHCKTEMKMADYLAYWGRLMEEESEGGGGEGGSRGVGRKKKETAFLYLKDWHFHKECPGYGAYTLPDFFSSDWLNELWDCRKDVEDDYRFVYMGPRGTWTPFHADVFRSYSWSANICGRKEWLLFPPGKEEKLRDSFGRLPFDVCDTTNHSVYEEAIRVVQEAGEIIFVPSGWHHQVHNMADTISINHNWVNAFNIHHMWRHLKSELLKVKQEIADCRAMEGWTDHCQVMLRACAGMDYRELLQMLCLLAGPRLEEVRALSSAGKPAHFQALELFVAKAWSSEGLDFFGREFLGLVQHEEPQDRRLALSHTKGKLHPTPSMVLQYTPLIERLSSLLQNCSGLEAGCESEPPAQGLLNLLPDNIKELALHNEATSVSYTTTSTAWIIIIYEIQKINDIIVEMTTDRDLQALLPWTASLF